MLRICWEDSLSVGVNVIDEQHRVWIEKLRGLSAAIESHQESSLVSKTLHFMADYVKSHFSAEEELMAANNYPAIILHRLEHNMFRKILAELLALELEKQDSFNRLSDSVNNFQLSWLKNHIQKTDMQFADFLKGNIDEL